MASGADVRGSVGDALATGCMEASRCYAAMKGLYRAWSGCDSSLGAMALDSPVQRHEDKEAEVPLSGVRAEFRTALRAEIEAAKRAVAPSVIPLEAGRRMGRLAGVVQYVFSTAAAISVPSDSPGELVVEGLPPVDAVVVSVEGLDVTVSVSVDLGDRVPRAVLRRDLVLALRRLIARIEQAGSEPNPAGDRLLGEVPASGAPEVIDDALLDSAQASALGSGLGRDITFICGPPGTAKTRTIGSIGAHLYRRGRSLLLVSHTNRSVDQALVEIAQQLEGEVGAGAMLRLGVPSDRRLLEREDLLLDAVAWKRQAELRDREARLRAQRGATRRRIAECERLIAVAAWAVEGRAELADFLLRLDALHSRETSARRLVEEVARGARGEAELLARLAEAQAAARAARQVQRLCAELPRLAAELDAARAAVAVADAAVTRARWDFEKAVELESLVGRERALPPLAEQRRAVEALAVREAEARHELDAARETLREAEEAHATASSAKGSRRRVRGFWFQVRIRRVVAQRRARLAAARAELAGISGRLGRASAVLAELEELDRQLAPFRKLDSAAQQEAQLRGREAERRLAAARQTQLDRRREETERHLAEAAAAVEHFRESRAAEPSGLVARIEPQLAELRHLRERLRETERGAGDLRRALDADLSLRLAAIEALGLGHGSTRENAEERFVELALAQSEATRLATEIDAAAAQAEVTAAQRALGAIDTALARIDPELEAIRHAVIADAKVIATTLTRVYLRNELEDRRFDTVILDEASMASIPALWIAARLADANVVVVSDLRQRPPIDRSEHPLADKWLGRNIFDAPRMQSATDPGNPPPHVIQLSDCPDTTTGS
jgi:AAA domain